MLSRSLLIGTILLATPAALAQTMAPHSTMAPHTTAAKPASPMSSAPATTTAPTASSSGVAHYSSSTEATARCTGDTVVWANPNSKALHLSGDRYFGTSKKGFYACEKDAMAGGYHMAGHRKHSAKTA